MNFDFLVIGSGAAGLSFALKVCKHGTVGIITKKDKAESNTNYAQGGIAAVIDKLDSYEKHIEDTLIAGAGLCKREAVELIVQRGPDVLHQLLEMGANFTHENGKLHLGREGGHSHERIVHAHDATGREIERVLLQKVDKEPNITILEHHYALELITEHHLGRRVTRYDDDITISSSQGFLHVHELIGDVLCLIRSSGYEPHIQKKFDVRRQHQCQMVTGLVVNEEANLPRKKRRWLRAVQHRFDTPGGKRPTITREQLQGWKSLVKMIRADRYDG